MTGVPTKICTKCGIEKEATLDNFHHHSGCRFSVSSSCKVCNNRIYKERREANYEEVRAREKYRTSLIPKDILRKRVQKTKDKNPEFYREYAKEYAKEHYKNNVERYNEKSRRYRLNNLEKRREYERSYKKLKYDNDPIIRLTENMRTSMYKSLQKMNCIGKIRYLTYSIEDLHSHIESQFKDGMSWDNRSEWHIDHIIPVSHFNYDSPYHPEFVFCWSLFNMRPLWASDNMSKHDELDYDKWQESLLELLELVREESIGHRSYKNELTAQ